MMGPCGVSSSRGRTPTRGEITTSLSGRWQRETWYVVANLEARYQDANTANANAKRPGPAEPQHLMQTAYPSMQPSIKPRHSPASQSKPYPWPKAELWGSPTP